MVEGYKTFGSLAVDSSIDNLPQVEALIDNVCVELGVNEDKYGNVLIAVTEAFNNAVQHGNANNVSLKVLVDVGNSNDKVLFCIKDQGNGFDYKHLPDPTAPENIEKENGRGIFLMKSLADDVEFDENGKVVNLFFGIN